MISVDDVLERVQMLLVDPGTRRWPLAERLTWITDADREIRATRPDAGTVTVPITLTANNTRQSVPAGYLRLIDPVRNTTGKEPITAVDAGLMDRSVPGWHNTPAGTRVRHIMQDARDPRTFYVWPPVSSARQIDAVMLSAPPAATVAVGDTLLLDATYLNAIVDYVLYRAFSKDATDAFYAERAVAHFTQFAAAAGRQAPGES